MPESSNALQSPLKHAIRSKDLNAFVTAATQRPEGLLQETPFGSWLHFAAKQGAVEIVGFLIDQGLPIDQHGGLSDSLPIEQAAAGGHADVVRLLIEKGSPLDTDVPTRNPLFSAIYAGSLEVAQLLLDAGIDCSTKYSGENMHNMNALRFAEERGQKDIAALLRNRS